MDKEALKKELVSMGLKKGDTVLAHSALAAIGKIEGGGETLLQAFLEVLGKTGTLAVPTFGKLGKFTEITGAHPRAVRSIHPLASVAAIGRDAKEICADHWKAETAHAENTPYMRIAEKNGYVMLLGVDQDRNTTMHTVEAMLQLPYLDEMEKTFETETGRKVQGKWKYFPGPHRDFIGLDRLLRDSGKMKIGKIGNAVTRLIRSRDLIKIILEEGKRDPAFVLCKNPNCDDCVKQRAKINSHVLSLESFYTATSSALAGKYVPEILENMEMAGIKNIELDYLNGMPVNALSIDKVAEAVKEIKKAGVNIISLKMQCVPDNFNDFIEFAVKTSIPKIVIPLTEHIRDELKFAAKKKVKISLYNSHVSSSKATEIISTLKEDGFTVGFAFSPANFAAVGEKPFLFSINKKLCRSIDQLYIGDATFSGTPEILAHGNSEIKELVSKLRCASFSGHMIFSGENRHRENLKNTTERFINLIRNM